MEPGTYFQYFIIFQTCIFIYCYYLIYIWIYGVLRMHLCIYATSVLCLYLGFLCNWPIMGHRQVSSRCSNKNRTPAWRHDVMVHSVASSLWWTLSGTTGPAILDALKEDTEIHRYPDNNWKPSVGFCCRVCQVDSDILVSSRLQVQLKCYFSCLSVWKKLWF